MGILQIVGVALLLTFTILLVREQRPSLALLLSMATGILLFALMLPALRALIESLQSIATRAAVHSAFLGTLLKVLAIAYISEFAAQSIRDAGLDGTAAKVEFAGKILILVQAMPLLQMILDTILKLLAK